MINNNFKLYKKQRGITMISVFVIIFFAALVGTILLKLGPAYMNYWTLCSIMDKLADPPEPIMNGMRGITSAIDGYLNVNGVTGISVKKDFQIERDEGNNYNVSIEYEDRRHVFYNIDAVLSFEYKVVVKTQS